MDHPLELTLALLAALLSGCITASQQRKYMEQQKEAAAQWPPVQCKSSDIARPDWPDGKWGCYPRTPPAPPVPTAEELKQRAQEAQIAAREQQQRNLEYQKIFRVQWCAMHKEQFIAPNGVCANNANIIRHCQRGATEHFIYYDERCVYEMQHQCNADLVVYVDGLHCHNLSKKQ